MFYDKKNNDLDALRQNDRGLCVGAGALVYYHSPKDYDANWSIRMDSWFARKKN